MQTRSPHRSRSPPERKVRISNKRKDYTSAGIDLKGEPKIKDIKTL